VATTASPDLARSTVPVLWSVALSRLVLGALALVYALRWHAYTLDYGADPTDAPQLMVRSGPPWLSRGAGVVLLLAWAALEVVPRLEHGWRQTVRRRRLTGRLPVGPDLASPALAQVTGLAAGLVAVSAAVLLLARPLPEYFGDITTFGDVTSFPDLGLGLAIEGVGLALLAAGLLAVGSPVAVGRTLLAAAAAGVAAGLVTVGLLSTRLSGFGAGYVIGLVAAWVVVLLIVGGLAASPVWYRLRRGVARVLLRRPAPA
jgi:hypothetical protein